MGVSEVSVLYIYIYIYIDYFILTTRFIPKKKKLIYVYDEVNFGDLLNKNTG